MKKTLNIIVVIVVTAVVGITYYNFTQSANSVSKKHFDAEITQIKDSLKLSLALNREIKKTVDTIKTNDIINLLNIDTIKAGLLINFNETQKLTNSELTFIEQLKRKVKHSPELASKLRRLRNLFN